MDTIREEVVKFMENDKEFSKLKNEKWYEMEDKLVALCEKVSGRRDTTYDYAKIKEVEQITLNWLNGEVNNEELQEFVDEVLKLEYKTFASVIDLVNQYFRTYNTDGEIDGLAMEIEELFEEK